MPKEVGVGSYKVKKIRSYKVKSALDTYVKMRKLLGKT